MEQEQIRLLKAEEIECRVGMISEKGLSLLLYKDARVDMKILDEVYGSSNWQRKHEVIGGNLYCTVSIWDEKKQQWIAKMDVGTKSNTEKEKGEASDSFKRACFSIGIGRELYTAPFIWISAEKIDIHKKADRYVTYDKFKVSSLSYNENREIKDISIVNQNGKIVYQLKSTSEKNTNEHIDGINQELRRTGIALDTVLRRYGVSSIEEMDENTYKKAMNSLKRTKPKAA
ncbi:hypothetical protein [Roseburia faecis]|uniref:hypothetical protein n=1 Tax=Roseburia faecis TaxID=301302 RepID=UPI003F996131